MRVVKTAVLQATCFADLDTLLQMMLKCADIGHLAAAPANHKRWAYQLEEEFFQQVLSFSRHLCTYTHILIMCSSCEGVA